MTNIVQWDKISNLSIVELNMIAIYNKINSIVLQNGTYMHIG